MIPQRDEEELRKAEERRKVLLDLWAQVTIDLWRTNRRKYRDIIKRIKQLENRP